MFNYHNTVTVSYGESVVHMPNAVIDVKSYLLSNRAFARYIRMGNGTYAVSKAAVLQNINTDITKGVLTAEYFASLASDEENGKTFSFFGLSENTISMVNSASFAPIVKENGKSLDVCVKIFVTLSDADCFFAAGDNPLARFLLGASALNGTLGAYASENNQFGAYTVFEPEATALPAAMTYTDSAINFSAEIPVGYPSVWITLNGLPILRAAVYYKTDILKQYSGVVPSDKVFNIEVDEASSTVTCVQDGAVILALELTHSFSKLIKCGDEISCGITASAKLKSDKLFKFAAAVGGGSIIYFTIDGKKTAFSWCKSHSPDVVDFELTRGGYLVLFGDDLKIYGSTGKLAATFEIKCGDKNQINFEGNAFHYVKITGDSLKRYKLTAAGVCTELSGLEGMANAQLGSGHFSSVIASPTASYFADSTSGFLPAPSISSLFTKFGAVKQITLSDHIAFVELASDSVPDKLVNMIGTESCDVPKGASVKLFGQLALTDGGGARKLYYYNRGTKKFVLTEGDIVGSETTQVCILGEYVLALDSKGRISAYYCVKKNAFYTAQNLTPGKTAALMYRGRDYVPAGKSKVRAIFSLNF